MRGQPGGGGRSAIVAVGFSINGWEVVVVMLLLLLLALALLWPTEVCDCKVEEVSSFFGTRDM